MRWGFNSDSLTGMFVGTPLRQVKGRVTFTDDANGLVGYFDYGAYTFKKQDFCWGEIHHNGKKVSEVTANYMGFMDFDEVRYWDVRESDRIWF